MAFHILSFCFLMWRYLFWWRPLDQLIHKGDCQTDQMIFYCRPWETLNKLGAIQHFDLGQWKKYKMGQGIHLDRRERRKQQSQHLWMQTRGMINSADPEGIIKRWCHSVKTRISCQCSLRKHPDRMWNVTTKKYMTVVGWIFQKNVIIISTEILMNSKFKSIHYY